MYKNNVGREHTGVEYLLIHFTLICDSWLVDEELKWGILYQEARLAQLVCALFSLEA